jgi:kinesin family member 2/24
MDYYQRELCKHSNFGCRLTSFKSGRLAVQADLVAPYQSGLQLLRMPKTEFLSRCLATKGVTEEQALLVHDRLWRMHVSQKPTEEAYSSAVSPEIAVVHFRQRIRPGMVVRLRPSDSDVGKQELVLVMSLAPQGTVVDDGQVGKTYVCAKVEPAAFRNAYSLSIWKQKVICEDDFDVEVVLEYDEATRYYFLGI